MIVLSTFSAPNAYHFSGYCFMGEDFIHGAEGAEQYFRAKGRRPEPGNDGCYVTVNRDTDGWRFGTDSRGLSRLFIYRRGAIWAIGSSLYGLVSHLRKHGVFPKPRLAFLELYGIGGTFANQPASLEMPFEDIELIPSFCTALVRDAGLIEISPLPEGLASTYENGLEQYLSLWLSRLTTFMNHPDSIVEADLSGGMDSRVVFAFLLATGKFDSRESQRYRLASNFSMKDDYEVAAQIAGDYALPLNGSALPNRFGRDPQDALEAWRDNSLCVYMPVYLSNSAPDPLRVHTHGAGGGASRQTQSDTSFAVRLGRYRKKLSSDAFSEWATSVTESMVRLSHWKPNADPFILHYREFRNRFHFGHRPHRKTMFTPLNTILLDQLSESTPPGSRQVFYDVMASLAPELMDYPYDRDAKKPTADERKQITTVPFSVSQGGRVYASLPPAPGTRKQRNDAYTSWLAVCEKVLSISEIQDVLGDEKTALCKTTLAQARNEKKELRSNHVGMRTLSLACSLAFAMDLYNFDNL